VQAFDFTGLTTGRVTQLSTNYSNLFTIEVDQLSASSFSNPGIDVFPDAGCSLGVGDCEVFTFNMQDPTSLFDAPRTNKLIMPQQIMAFGGDFIQLGYTAGGGTATGPVTLTFGAQSVTINDYVDGSGNGFFGFLSTAPATTLTFSFVKSGTIQNDIFQVYNPAYADFVGSVETPAEMIEDLKVLVNGASLQGGIENSATAKLNAALAAINAGQTSTACSKLQDFITFVTSQRGKKIPTSLANTLIQGANDVRSELGC
jgi:hypothetical protein